MCKGDCSLLPGLFEFRKQYDPPVEGKMAKFVKGKIGIKPEEKVGQTCMFKVEGHADSVIKFKERLITKVEDLECPSRTAYTSIMMGGKCLAKNCINGYSEIGSLMKDVCVRDYCPAGFYPCAQFLCIPQD